MKKLILTCAITLFFACCANAAPTELIANGDFETGDFTGWTVTNLAGGTGNWFVDAPGTTTPVSNQVTLASGGSGSFGRWYAVTDQGGPGTHSLTQSFTGLLDHTGGPIQFATVDILSAGASPFDMGAGVLANFYLGVDPKPNPNPFTGYSFDITSIVGAGGTFQIRFGEVDNLLFHNQGIDNVSILAQPIPAPGAILLGSIGMGFVSWLRRRKTL